jgi:hypothetical protein
MPADNRLNRRRGKRVEYLVDLRAWDSEDVLNALPFQRVNHYLRARL